jgi:hypothetical protein
MITTLGTSQNTFKKHCKVIINLGSAGQWMQLCIRTTEPFYWPCLLRQGYCAEIHYRA